MRINRLNLQVYINVQNLLRRMLDLDLLAVGSFQIYIEHHGLYCST